MIPDMSKLSRVRAEALAFERERLTWRRKLRAERDGCGSVVLRVYADVTQTGPTKTIDIPVYTYGND